MTAKQPKQENVLNEQEISEIKRQINNLPKDDPKLCEGLIRELYKKISHIKKESAKEQLCSELRVVSTCGLNDELKTMVKDHGLHMEALHLVLNYLTTKEELGEYFFTHIKDDDDDKPGMSAVRKRLGPKLEVLGGLYAEGINVEQPWVANLINKASSFQSLSRFPAGELWNICEKATDEEKEEANRLAKIAEFHTCNKHASTVHDGHETGKTKESGKYVDRKKLEKAKALMSEVKEKAKEQSDEAKKTVKKKMDEITNILKLPFHWNKHDIGYKPEEHLKQLDGIIDQLDSVVEIDDAYESELEVVRKASGGRALCGIYYSENAHPITAEIPFIVMPNELILSSPNNSQQMRYMTFSSSQDAERYVHGVKSSSSNIGLNVSGSVEMIDENTSFTDLTNSDEETLTLKEENIFSATVIQYIGIATKTFQIEQEQLKLNPNAIKIISTVVKDEETARLFMKRYGSHFPAGLHTLGGVLFRIATAESKSIKDTAVLSQKAAQQLQGQISVGFLGGMFGISASVVSGEHSTSSGKTVGQNVESNDVTYTFSSQSMGPATTNPATFNKLLANNSTWALIDRGSPRAYLPIWELICDEGKDFEIAAKILEDTWNIDEKERKREKEMRIKKDKNIEEQNGNSEMAYISNISFLVSDCKGDEVPNMIKVNMNAGCGGNVIYPQIYHSHNKSEAIAGLAFVQGDIDAPTGYTKINQDLNKGAWGTYNYLCITKIGENKMTAIDFIASEEELKDKIINGYFRFPQNLNTGYFSIGNYVYLLYKTDTGNAFNNDLEQY